MPDHLGPADLGPAEPGPEEPAPSADDSWRAPGGFPWPPIVLIGVVVLLSAVVIGYQVSISPEQIADQAVKAANGLSGLRQQLRELPVAAEQRPFVEGWLDGWGTFIDAGNRYAQAVRTGNIKAANEVARSGDPAQRRADAFARGNGIDACLLQAAFRKPKGPSSGL